MGTGRVLLALGVVVALVALSPVMGTAAELSSQIALTHTLDDYQELADGIRLTYTVAITNTGAEPLTGIVLEFEPVLVITDEEVSLETAELPAGETARVAFSVRVVTAGTAEEFARQALSWSVSATDSRGAVLEDSLESHGQ